MFSRKTLKEKMTRDGKEPLTDDLIASFIIGFTTFMMYQGIEVPLIGKIGYIGAISWVFGLKNLGKLGNYISRPME